MVSPVTIGNKTPPRFNFVVQWGNMAHPFVVPFHTQEEAFEKAAQILRDGYTCCVQIHRI